MRRLTVLLSFAFALPVFAAAGSGASSYRCDIKDPAIAVPRLSACSDQVVWNYGLDAVRKSDPALFDRMVQEQITTNTNVGGALFKFPDGSRRAVYRSSFLAKAPGCISDLVENGGVRSVINLYNKGDLKSHEQLSVEEKALFQKAGAQIYTDVLNYEYKFHDVPKEKIIEKVREIVSVVAGLPGNVLMHCYGGMHRTGLVFAVMQKCLNKLPLEKVLNEYRCHVAYESEEKPGGRSMDNEEVIRDFPCEKIVARK